MLENASIVTRLH